MLDRSTFVRAFVGVLALAIGGVATAEETPRISAADLIKRIDAKDPSLIVLDVRTPQEYANGHVPGAVNIPYTHLPARISELPGASDKDIVVYCATGVRAERAASRFKENGYRRILHLDGDMKQWEAQSRPVEK
jgi:phage shock protein E